MGRQVDITTTYLPSEEAWLMDVRKLSEGQYFLSVEQNRKVHTLQILIKR